MKSYQLAVMTVYILMPSSTKGVSSSNWAKIVVTER